MNLEEIRQRRSELECEIGNMLRAFERESGVHIAGISFGPVQSTPVGQAEAPRVVQPREMFECLVKIAI